MEETAAEGKVVLVSREERDGAYGDYSCSNILFCKYPLHEVVRALFFKCFGFETSQPAAVKETEPSTTEPVSSSADPGPTVTSVSLSVSFFIFHHICVGINTINMHMIHETLQI